MSLHINKNYAKKRGISKKLLLSIRAVMLAEQVDLVAGDFNGTAWRRQTNTGNLSIIEEAFADTDLPMPPGPTPLWGPGGSARYLVRRLRFSRAQKVRQRGACSVPHEALGVRPKDRSCHREVWRHLDFVEHHSSNEP